MAITVPGSGSSATTSVTIPTHAVGDMIVIAARGTVAPTAPAAGGTVPTWTTPTNQTGVNNSVGWRLATTIATATNHTSGTWTNAAQMHVLILRRTGTNTLAVGNDPAQGGANNTQTMIYPAFTLTAGKVSNLVIRYGARGTADTEVRTDGAFTTGGTWHTEQPATTPTSAVFSKVVTASEGTFTATPAGVNAAYRCGTVEITETAAAVGHSQPVDDAIAGTDTSAKAATSPKADAITGTDVQVAAVTSPQADAATVTDAIDPQLTADTFSPDDIAGLYAWYDADQLGLANNDPVSSWTDESGGGRHMTGAATPLYKTGIQNGLPGVLFDGTDDTLSNALGADTSRTFFIVAQQSSITTGKTLFSGSSNLARMVTVSGTGAWAWNLNQASVQVNLGGNAANASVVSLVVTDASTMAGYVDSGSATSFDPNNTVTTATTWQMGTAPAGSFWNGYIFEVVVYDSALGTTDRESVRDYLLSKYGIAAADDHTQPVDDAATVTDAIAIRVTATKADAAAGTDAQAKAATHPLADAIGGTDATAHAWIAARSQPDAIAGTDAQAKTARHPLADTAAATDARASSVGHALADPVAGTDAATRRVGSARADTIAGTDTRASASAKPLADAIAGTDARTRVWAAKLTVADGLSVTDNVSTSAAGANERTVDDSLAATDALARTTTTIRTVADSAAGTDAKAASVSRPLADTIAGTDARSRVWTAKLTIADGLAATDALGTSSAGANEKALDDSISATDAISVSLGVRRTLTDSLAATDALAAQADYARQPTDALAVTDALARAWAIIETQADALTVTDAVNARIPPSRWDMDDEERWPPDTDEDWPADADEDWEAQTDDRWLVSAESRW